MALRRVKGNTWVWEGYTALMPLYMLGEKEAILIDTGYAAHDREGLTKLFDEDLTLRGIICTHAHFDHSGNVRFLQQRYGVPVAAYIIEAGIAVNTEAYRANYIGMTYGKTREIFPEECFTADMVLMPEDTTFTLCGVEFGMLLLPGHCAGHIGISTPDNVLYVADCLLDEAQITAAKMPTSMFVQRDLESKRSLLDTHYDAYILAHTAVVTDIAPLVEKNIEAFYRKREEIISCLSDGMTFPQWLDVFCQKVGIRTRSALKFAIIERNFSNFVSWMTDEGLIEIRRDCCAKTYYKVEN